MSPSEIDCGYVVPDSALNGLRQIAADHFCDMFDDVEKLAEELERAGGSVDARELACRLRGFLGE